MPTIIDSLIVTLGLDARRFNQGQKQAVQTLQQLQTQSAAIHRIIQSSTNALNQPLQNVNKGLQNLSSQANRTGFAVAAGAKAGASGLSAMAGAALAAYAALKAVQSVLESVRAASARGAEAGRIAAEIGGGTQRTDAYAKAVNVATNAPIDAVKEEMAAFQRHMNEWRQGLDKSGWLNQMALAGLNNLSQSDTEEDVQYKVADVLSKLSPDVAAARAQQMGFGLQGRHLRSGTEAVKAATDKQMEIATTYEQSRAYQRLQGAISSTFFAYDGLFNKFVEANPGLTTAIENFDGWLRTLQSTPDGLAKVELAFKAVSFAIGTVLVAAIARATWAMTAFWLLPAMRGLMRVGRFLGGGAAAAAGAGVGAVGGAAAAGAAGIFAPDSILPEGAVKARQGLWDKAKRWMNRAVTGAKEGEEKLPPAGDIAAPTTPHDSENGKGSVGAVLGHALTYQGRQLRNYCATLVNNSLEAAGIKGSGSALASSFKNYGSAVSIKDVKKGDIFYSLPAEGEGTTGHVGYATGPVQNGKVPVFSSHISGSGTPGQAGSEWRDVNRIQIFRRPNYTAATDLIRSANAARMAKMGSKNISNTSDLDINGGVHIHMDATKPAGRADHIAPEIENNTQISAFNSGLW